MFYLFSLAACSGHYYNCIISVVDPGFIKGRGDLSEYCYYFSLVLPLLLKPLNGKFLTDVHNLHLTTDRHSFGNSQKEEASGSSGMFKKLCFGFNTCAVL